MNTVTITETKNTVSVNETTNTVTIQEGQATVVTVATEGPQGPAFADGDIGDIIISGGGTVATIDAGVINNAKVASDAAIAGSKLQASSGSNSGTMSAANFTKLSGIETGATADQTASEIKTLLNSDGLTNSQISGSAAIAGTKISPDFGSQNITSTGNISGNAVSGASFSGNGASITNINAANIASGQIASARVPTLNQNTTGSAATLTTARTIAGVSFDGSANIDISYASLTNKLTVGDGGLTQNNFTDTLKTKLDGVATGATNVTNTNQLTNGAGFITASDGITGNAASATVLATARTIAGASFDGSANIDISYADLTNKLSVGDGGLTQNNFTNTLKTKLDGIETGATADQTASDIKTLFDSSGLVNSQIDASAGIAGTKISPDFGSQNIATTGNISAGQHLALTGTVPHINFNDSDNNPDYRIVNRNGSFNIEDISSNILFSTTTSQATITQNLDCSAGVDITGDLTVSGTVDGVDIAARNTLFGGLTSSSGVLTDGVTATTQTQSDNSNKVSTTAYVRAAVANLVNNAPSTLDTLNELSDALGADANFSTTVTNLIATKMPLAGGAFTGDITTKNMTPPSGVTNIDIGSSSLKYRNIFASGNITVDGTVDGRDLSADGTKLDGIESNATADQTASEIVALVADQTIAPSEIDMGDNEKIKLGTGTDLLIYHDGSNSVIRSGGTGQFQIESTNNTNIVMGNAALSETIFKGSVNGGTELYYDNVKKLETTSTGVALSGNLELSGAGGNVNTNWDDASWEKIAFDGSYNVNPQGPNKILLHDFSNWKAGFGVSNNLVSMYSGLDIAFYGLTTDSTASTKELLAKFKSNNAAELYYDNVKRLETTSTGVTVTGALTAGTVIGTNSVTCNNNIHLNSDSGKLSIGTGEDLQLYHDGNKSYIQDAGTGSLRVISNDLRIYNAANDEYMARFQENGSVELRYDAAKKLETQNTGIDVTGGVYATGTFTAGSNIKANTDGGKLAAGASDDLQLYHDSSNSLIANNTGTLLIRSDNLDLRPNTNSGEVYLRCTQNAAVELRYDSVKKLETTSTGIDVTGNITTSGQINISGTQPRLYLQDTNNDDDFSIYNLNGKFTIYNETDNDNALVIDSDSNVGINETSPARILHVNSGSTNEVARFESTDTEVTVEFKDTTGTASLKCRDDFRFNSSSAELARIDSSGQLAVGRSDPSEWESSYKSIQIHDAGTIYASSDDSFVAIGANHYLDTSGNWKYDKTDHASRLYQVDGGFYFQNAPSGSSGAALTFTNRFTIDSTGNVQIPADNAKLQIGASQDLQIYHDGTDSRIHNSTNRLVIRTSTVAGFWNSNGSEVLADFNVNGAANLYYDHSKKFNTTATGATITGTCNMTSLNCTSSGSTGANFTVGGDATISGGQLTLGTADSASGHLNAFELMTFNIDSDNDDTNRYFAFYKNGNSGSGTELFKILEDGNVQITNDTGKLQLGTSQDLSLYHNGNHSKIRDEGTGNLYIESVDGNIYLRVNDNEQGVTVVENGAVELYYDNVKQCETNSGGMNWADGKRAYFGNSSDLQIYHNGSDSLISNTTGELQISNNGSAVFLQSTAGENAVKLTVGKAVELYYDDSKKLETFASGLQVTGRIEIPDGSGYGLRIGDSADLQIYHDGSHSYIADTGTGNLNITASTVNINNAANSENIARFIQDGAVELYHDSSKKFETTSDGSTVYGKLSFGGSGTAIKANDNRTIELGNSSDLQLYHSGTHSYIKNKTGNLYVMSTDTEYGIEVYGDGAVKLNYDNSKKFETTSTGATVTGKLLFDSSTEQTIKLADNRHIHFGTDVDLKIYHDGSHAELLNNTGDLRLRSNRLELTNKDLNEFYITADDNGSIDLYYDGSKKFETHASGCIFTGSLYGLDNQKIELGHSGDLEIYHDGSNSYLHQQGTGSLIARVVNTVFRVYGDSNHQIANFIDNGGVELFHDNIRKFETYASGIIVYGSEGGDGLLNLYADEGDDNADKWRLQADTNGSFYLKNYTSGNWETNIRAVGDGTVELYYDNSLKLATFSGGISVTGQVNSDGSHMGDNDQALFGNSNDLAILHNATDSIINNATGNLFLRSATNRLQTLTAENMVVGGTNGEVELYYDNSKKLETTSSGANVTGKLGINVSSPATTLALQDTDPVIHIIRNFGSGSSDIGSINFGNNNIDSDLARITAVGDGATDNAALVFKTQATGNAVTERMRISSSGAVSINTTATTSTSGSSTASLVIDGNGNAYQMAFNDVGLLVDRGFIMKAVSGSTTVVGAVFVDEGNDACGNISFGDSGTTYATSSDYRIKENVVDITDGLTRLKQLKPYRFNFKKDTSKTVDGFFAHEAQTVVPEAVTGTKDEVDSKGNSVIQGIDQSKLVPLLTAALQEAIAKIEVLETKVAALEAA